jgi:hypothetical protein
MSCFIGVSHPLRYTTGGDVAREEDDAVEARIDLMQRAGVEWVLCDVPFPFEGAVGRASDAFRSFGELLDRWRGAGLKVLGVTPYPAGFEEGWKIDAGRPGGAKSLPIYEEACRFLAAEYAETVGAWVIGNQLNLERFRRPMTEAEALELMKRGGAGVKRGNPDALTGVNMFGFDNAALRMYSRLYPNDSVEFDYVGTNGFFGTFDPGGADTWHEKLALLKEMTGRPVIVLEFGYPSRGECMTEDERASGRTHHEFGKLPFVWREGHLPEEQAAYLERAFWIFTGSPDVKGAFWFSWFDRARCWNCGGTECPAGTANGLVDVNEKPKPAYHAFGRVARGEFDVRALYPDEPAFSDGRVGEEAVALARRFLDNERLRAEAACLRQMLGSRDARLEKLRASPGFRMLRFLMEPLARLAARRHGSG